MKLYGDGSFVYTPRITFPFSVEFEYLAYDGYGGDSITRVRIEVYSGKYQLYLPQVFGE